MAKQDRVTLSKEQFDELVAGQKIRSITSHSQKRSLLLKAATALHKEQKRKKRKQDSNEVTLFKRQIEDSDPFITKYGKFGLLETPFDFAQLFKFYEESDTLQECVDAMVNNTVGFGFHFGFTEDDLTLRDATEAKQQLQRAEDFLGQVNENESWTTMFKKVRKDYEVVGNGAMEVIRNRKGEVSMLHHLPINRMRMTRMDVDAIPVNIILKRDGREIPVTILKRFRRYAQHSSNDNRRLNMRWFKQFGDPRRMSAHTGEFIKGKPKLEASEVLWLKQDFGDLPYGLPRWIGAVLDVIGRRQAGFVNYDLFQNQGIPPMAITTNGMLTEASLDEIRQMVRGSRGVDQWNRILLLEVMNESMGLEDKGSTAKVDIKNLTDFRKEDLMFKDYIATTGRHIRQSFRLPDLYIGGGSETQLTFASAKAAQTVAEEQVFIPERSVEEERVNKLILANELGVKMWKFKLKGPQIVGGAEITKGVDSFTKAGALSVNQSIKLANRLFGTEISEFNDHEWAKFPIVMVLQLLASGRLKGIEDIADPAPTPQFPLTFGDDNGKQESRSIKMLKSHPKIQETIDGLNSKEIALYTKLRAIQDMVEAIDPDKVEDIGDL